MRVGRAIALGLILPAGFASAAHAGEMTTFSGKAAFYSQDYKGVTASGAQYDPAKFTCAHRTLPFGTRLLVTDTASRRSVVVVVTDRGPFNDGRAIDLSLAAAKSLRMIERGIIRITATVQQGATKPLTAAADR